jgi:NhaA family Na+:H+ antiporter
LHESGVHATLAGVILGLMTPARSYLSDDAVWQALRTATEPSSGERAQQLRRVQWAARETVSPLEFLESVLHPWVAFGIMPLFALANAGVPVSAAAFADPVALAVAAGLVIGKPAGVLLFAFAAVRLGAQLPVGVTWRVLAGGACLTGIGFTMALFIASLALGEAPLDAAKVGVLGASAVSAALGMAVLWRRPLA